MLPRSDAAAPAVAGASTAVCAARGSLYKVAPGFCTALPAGQDPMSLLVAAESGSAQAAAAAAAGQRTPRPMPLPDFRFLGCACSLCMAPAFSAWLCGNRMSFSARFCGAASGVQGRVSAMPNLHLGKCLGLTWAVPARCRPAASSSCRPTWLPPPTRLTACATHSSPPLSPSASVRLARCVPCIGGPDVFRACWRVACVAAFVACCLRCCPHAVACCRSRRLACIYLLAPYMPCPSLTSTPQ